MKPLEWSDLHINQGRRKEHRDRRGRLRVYVSLKNCAFVNRTLWLDNYPTKPETKAMILLEIARAYSERMKQMMRYNFARVT